MNVVCRLYNVDAAHQTPHCVNVQWIQIYLNHFLFGETIPDTFFLNFLLRFGAYFNMHVHGLPL